MQDVSSFASERASRYLELNNAKDYNVIMDKMHCFLERNACLLRVLGFGE